MQHLNVGGKTVHFEGKEVKVIVGNLVVFTDESVCNTANGTIINQGSGSISFGDSSQPPAQSQGKGGIKTTAHNSSRLVVSDLTAKVVIIAESRPDILVEGEGLDVELKEETVFVKGDQTQTQTFVSGSGNVFTSSVGWNNTTIIGNITNSQGISIGDGAVFVSSGVSHSKEVRIIVPEGSFVSVSNINGKVIVGNTLGPFVGKVSASHNMSVGAVGSANLSNTGSADIDVASVTGNLEVNISGSGDVGVSGGIVSNLEVKASGSGQFDFDGTATNANLLVCGSGDIKVHCVTGRLTKSTFGSGRIKVRGSKA